MFNSLLCSVTGLIIDAFGELRDQLEQVKEDMEVKSGGGFILFLLHFKQSNPCHLKFCFTVQVFHLWNWERIFR